MYVAAAALIFIRICRAALAQLQRLLLLRTGSVRAHRNRKLQMQRSCWLHSCVLHSCVLHIKACVFLAGLCHVFEEDKEPLVVARCMNACIRS